MLIAAAVLSSEVPDVSGEILIIKGADITALQTGLAPINTEHHNPEDLEKIDNDFGGFNTVVGRVISAKKIFDEKDCENQYELDAWDELQVPLIFGYVEFFDGEYAHDNAKAAASIVRMGNQNQHKKFILGFSVEGHTLKTSGMNNHVLEETVIKRIAATLKPANKTAVVRAVIYDSLQDALQKSDQSGKKKQKTTTTQETAEMHLQSQLNVLKLDFALSNLKKTLDAGFAVGAKSGLTGGAALQKVNTVQKKLNQILLQLKNKKLSKSELEKIVGTMDDRTFQHFCCVLQNYNALKYEEVMTKAYNELLEMFPSLNGTK